MTARRIGRRRGSGASIQHVAARHKKPFSQDADEDGLSDEEEYGRLELELTVRSSGAAGARGAGVGTRSAGEKPRLRNAKSQGHMRGGRPADSYYAGEGGRLAASKFLWPLDLGSEGSSAGPADDTATTGEEEAGDRRSSVEGFTPVLVLFPTDASTSDGGLMSDADPYAGPGGPPALHRASLDSTTLHP